MIDSTDINSINDIISSLKVNALIIVSCKRAVVYIVCKHVVCILCKHVVLSQVNM